MKELSVTGGAVISRRAHHETVFLGNPVSRIARIVKEYDLVSSVARRPFVICSQ